MEKRYKQSQYNIVVYRDKDYTILYNSFSGGIVKLKNSVYSKLSESDFIYDTFPFFYQLKKGGYVTDEFMNEFNRVHELMHMQSSNCFPKQVTYVIAPTLNCNLRCVYCFQKNLDAVKKCDRMSQSTMNKIVEFILKSNMGNDNLESINLRWFGGEPMLCYEKILGLSSMLKAKIKDTKIKLNASMTTNGTLLDEEKMKDLASVANLTSIQITVDGSEKIYCEKKQTNSETFNKVIENILLSTQYFNTKVRFNADKTNFKDIKAISQMLYEKCKNKEKLKVHFAQLRNYNGDCDECFYADDEYSEAKNEFYQNMYDNGYISQQPNIEPPKFKLKPFCGLKAVRNFVIDPLGNLYKCEHNLGDTTKIVGDIENGSYYNEEYQNFINDKKPEKCSKCEVFPLCNYAVCAVMQKLTGDENCKHYAPQLKLIINNIKNLVRRHIDE